MAEAMQKGAKLNLSHTAAVFACFVPALTLNVCLSRCTMEVDPVTLVVLRVHANSN